MKISTHALTWSATSAISQYLGGTNNFNSRTHVECDFGFALFRGIPSDFNSRTHVECDRCRLSRQRKIKKFQLTHSRGVRRTRANANAPPEYFNSRTHVECDVYRVNPDERAAISTHALTWSATLKKISSDCLPLVFQLTHSRGVRL